MTFGTDGGGDREHVTWRQRVHTCKACAPATNLQFNPSPNHPTTPPSPPVRKHALEQAEELGCTLREAATRVFSNSSGSYSSNVNLAVENSSWSDEGQLQEMYLK